MEKLLNLERWKEPQFTFQYRILVSRYRFPDLDFDRLIRVGSEVGVLIKPFRFDREITAALQAINLTCAVHE